MSEETQTPINSGTTSPGTTSNVVVNAGSDTTPTTPPGSDTEPSQETSETSKSQQVEGKVVEDREYRYPTHQDGRRNLSPGIYLDDVQRVEAEVQRAKLEGRDPDLENPPAVQGTPLYTKAQLSHAGNPVPVNTDADVVLPVVTGYADDRDLGDGCVNEHSPSTNSECVNAPSDTE